MSATVRKAIRHVGTGWQLAVGDPPPWMLVFSHLYLCAVLIHYGKRWDDLDVTVVLLFLTAWSMIRPQRLEPFFLANLLVIAEKIFDYPRVANHSAVQLFIALFVMTLLGAAIAGRRPLAYRHLADGLRGLAVILYFYVAFHKLNTGFLNPATSCANWYHDKFLSSTFGFTGSIRDILPAVVYHWSPWFVIAAEFTTFALLLSRRTWIAGLCAAMPVHLYVSLSGFTDFSSLMHAVMVLFLPAHLWARGGRVAGALSFYRCMSVAFAVLTYYLDDWGASSGAIRTVQGMMYDVAVIAVIAVLALAARRRRSVPACADESASMPAASPLAGRRRWFHVAFPALIFAWAAIPYTGLSTNGSLTMFSNLVTAPGRANHLLIDADATRIFGFQDDLVQVIDMEPSLARKFRYSPIDDLVTRSEIALQLQRALRDGDRPMMAFLIEDGEPVFYGDLRNSPYADWPLWSRWLSFREIDPTGEARCRW